MKGSYFHGKRKKRKFFEGWYLKHQCREQAISFIPAFHVREKGEKSASIQVITPKQSVNVLFPSEQFFAEENRFCCRIGKNIFSEKGISVDIETEEFSVKGKLLYGSFAKPSSDVMDIYGKIPFLQCNHGVLSFSHSLRGALNIQGETINFGGGTGYIEKDWGSSFPESYLWTQCGWYDKGECSIMVSVADIPFALTHFNGCICTIYYHKKEYRLATYKGVKIEKLSSREVLLIQGELKLYVRLLREDGKKLQAPKKGAMDRIILESLTCTVRYIFQIREKVLFDVTSEFASFESCGLEEY